MKQLHWACSSRGAHKCEKCHLPFWQGSHFFRFLEPESTGDSYVSPNLTNPSLHYMFHMESKYQMVQVLPVVALSWAAAWDPSRHCLSPVWPLQIIKEKRLLILLEHYRVIFVLNHFKGL